jgi:hypothetical protein
MDRHDSGGEFQYIPMKCNLLMEEAIALRTAPTDREA